MQPLFKSNFSRMKLYCRSELQGDLQGIFQKCQIWIILGYSIFSKVLLSCFTHYRNTIKFYLEICSSYIFSVFCLDYLCMESLRVTTDFTEHLFPYPSQNDRPTPWSLNRKRATTQPFDDILSLESRFCVASIPPGR